MSPTPRTLRIELDPALGRDADEAWYVLRVLTRIAGYAARRTDSARDVRADLYYGPRSDESGAAVRIRRGSLPFGDAAAIEPDVLDESGPGPAALRFRADTDESAVPEDAGHLRWDLVFAAFWLLTGPTEPKLGRDARDNLDVRGTALARLGLLRRPLVSEWGVWLRERFEAAGLPASPWRRPDDRATLVLTHDVDYPEIRRGIEALRAVGSGRLGRAWAVASGSVDFWRFGDWMDLSESLGGRSTFFFMARRGSLLEYLRGTPDAFYDIDSPRFRGLFTEIRARGHEIALHLSYHAHRSVQAMEAERRALEAAAGPPVTGNRHHYWHLDPDDPHETLRRHTPAGLRWDSSLGFEHEPGFRRGIAHPFRPWDSHERDEMPLLEVPPTWMDDHFDRRTQVNGITDPDAVANELLAAVARTGGVAVLDYHVRGMEGLLFPRYGPWLEGFLNGGAAHPVQATSLAEVVDAWEAHELSLVQAAPDGARVG